MPRRGENIRKRKDGRWEGRYYISELNSGKRLIRSVYAKTYTDVKEKLLKAKIAAESVNCERNMESEMQFCYAALEWLAAVENTKKHSTYIKYRSIYERHIKDNLDKMLISQLNPTIIAEVYRGNMEKPLSDNMKREIICVLNQIFSYVESYYHIKVFRIPYQRQRKRDKPVMVLNQTEQLKLLQYLYYEMDIYKMGIIVCISTGLRLGEICSLKWKDIDLSRKVLHVNTTVQRTAVDGKSSKTILWEGEPKSVFSKREIPLSEDVIKLLISYYDASAKYVINSNKPMEPRTYQNKFQYYLKSAGIEKKNFHILRHTFATNCIDSGADVKSLSEILGHSDVKITLNRYVHPAFETKRQHMNSLSAVYGQLMGQCSN